MLFKTNRSASNTANNDGTTPKPPVHPTRPIVRNPSLGFAALFGLFFIMLMLISFLGNIVGIESEKSMRIFQVLQDIFVFIAPALVAAILVTRLPASLLQLNVKPRLRPTLMAMLVLFLSIPAMEVIIQFNESIHFPEALSGLEETLRGLENSAGNSTALLSAGTSVGDLIISILIIGLLTGLAEELFFRGALQNLLMSTRIRRHLAIWIAAAIFSALHMQFFGFIPRLLLGAYFGYLIWWTGSVWVPVIAHAFNNTLVTVTTWLTARMVESGATEAEAAAECFSPSTDILTVALSVVVTILGIIILRRISLRENPYLRH